jgi:hypothetical protein
MSFLSRHDQQSVWVGFPKLCSAIAGPQMFLDGVLDLWRHLFGRPQLPPLMATIGSPMWDRISMRIPVHLGEVTRLSWFLVSLVQMDIGTGP